MWILRAALVLWLLPAAAVAQEAAKEALSSAALQMGLPSASLDRRALDTSRPHDLFLAAPATYAPGFHEPPRLVDPRFFCCDGFAGPVFVTAPPWWAVQPQVVYVPVLVREAPRPAPPPAAPPAPPPALMPGTPKTFYVIPRCYAGDKPPDPDALPPGCDIAALRVIPPRVP